MTQLHAQPAGGGQLQHSELAVQELLDLTGDALALAVAIHRGLLPDKKQAGGGYCGGGREEQHPRAVRDLCSGSGTAATPARSANHLQLVVHYLVPIMAFYDFILLNPEGCPVCR